MTTTTNISTLEELQAALEGLGYNCAQADLDGDKQPEPLLTTTISVDNQAYPIVILQDDNGFLIDCEFCLIKDLHANSAEKLSAQILRLLTLNHEIAPFAFSVVDDTLDGIDDDDPIVLVHRLTIGDLCEEEVDAVFALLRRAVNVASLSI